MNVWYMQQYKSAWLKDIPCWVLKDLVNQLAEPVLSILMYVDKWDLPATC